MGREMVGVELEQFMTTGHTADDDVFFVFTAFFEVVHGSPEAVDTHARLKIAHSPRPRTGKRREGDKFGDGVAQTGNNLCFQVL